MKRLLLFLAAASAVLALPATAAAFRGVVVAKDPARHALVIASHGGVVRTVRAPGYFRAVRAGARLVYSARRLSDGTFRAAALRVSGRAHRALLRGIVVRHRLSDYLLSSGGSVIAVRASSRGFTMASRRGYRPGDRVLARVAVRGGRLTALSFQTLGHSGTIELEGIFLGVTDAGQLRLAVEHRGEVFVTVPGGFQLPQLSPGDEIELVVAVDSAGAFTLVTVQSDDEDDDDHEGIDEDQGKIEVKGQVTDLSGSSITVQPGGGSPVTCAIPDGALVSGFNVDDGVEMKCALVKDQLTLVNLKREDDDDDDQGDDEDDDGSGGGDGD